MSLSSRPYAVARYPDKLDCQVTVRLTNGETHVMRKDDYEGGLARPMSWARVVEKFHWLAEPYADALLRQATVAEVDLDAADWDAYEAARRKLIPNLSRRAPAARYLIDWAIAS